MDAAAELGESAEFCGFPFEAPVTWRVTLKGERRECTLPMAYLLILLYTRIYLYYTHACMYAYIFVYSLL